MTDPLSHARILEIPPGGATAGQRQLYEMGVYFLGGPGHTLLQQQGMVEQRVDWQEGSLLSVPLNARQEHFNDGDEPISLLVVTTFPFVLNAFNSERFIDENPFAFTDRYDASGDYFKRSDYPAPDWLTTNFVADIRARAPSDMTIRGAGHRVMHWTMAATTCSACTCRRSRREATRRPIGTAMARCTCCCRARATRWPGRPGPGPKGSGRTGRPEPCSRRRPTGITST